MSADGKSLYAIIDSGVQGEIWRFPADGRGEGKAVTSGSAAYIWEVVPAPKGNAILYSNKRGKLFHLDAADGSQHRDRATKSSSDAAFGSYAWSADGRYVAYTFLDARDISQVALYDTQTRQRTEMTSGKYESYSPAFSPDGAWLYFLSTAISRRRPALPGATAIWAPPSCAHQAVCAAARPRREVSVHAGRRTHRQQDEKADASDKPGASAKPAASKPSDKPEDEKAEKQAPIVLAGVQDRLWEVPVRSGEYVRPRTPPILTSCFRSVAARR
jgi:tricorn protease